MITVQKSIPGTRFKTKSYLQYREWLQVIGFVSELPEVELPEVLPPTITGETTSGTR